MLLLLSPWIIGFVAFTMGPMVLSFYYSFTHYDLLSSPHWIGLDNYRFMFGKLTLNGQPDQGDPFFWTSVRNTLWIIVFGVPLRIFFGIATAMLLTRPKRGGVSAGPGSDDRDAHRNEFPAVSPRSGNAPSANVSALPNPEPPPIGSSTRTSRSRS